MRVLRVSHSAVVREWRERERALRRRGHEVLLLSARRWDEFGRSVPLEPDPGEEVRGVPTLGTHPALFVYAPGPLWRALGEEWDVVDVHEEPFALATAEVLLLRRLRAWLGRRPAPPYLLYSAQNLPKRYPPPFRWLERAALRGAAGVHTCNDAAGRIVRDKGATGAVETVPLGVDPAVFRPAAPDAGRRPDPDRFRVGYAGRLAAHKGVGTLLDAVLADDRLRLDLAGAGPLEGELRRRAAPAGERVRFLGTLDGADLAAFYRSVDVLAVPSLETPGWVEQFGRVAVEAMACGVPVVASATGALPDVVGGAGLLVPADDPAALGAALRRVADDPDLAATMRADGLRRAAACTWDAVAERYARLYARAVAPAGGPRRAPAGELGGAPG
ncbi:glycosyltransferase family 4 protein [Puerhibacterium sp. TATVAM-FAB25]|uniref:glycosyltransferase family 4 protein n=1 Tax=Puerhibacterium sp. TATVAM-FAB25 TaxID=3093699 RepID=UPI00397C3B96